jgi:hypothetical protein
MLSVAVDVIRNLCEAQIKMHIFSETDYPKSNLYMTDIVYLIYLQLLLKTDLIWCIENKCFCL